MTGPSFSPRFCKVPGCGWVGEPGVYGDHIFGDHPPAVVETMWPGGLVGLLADLEASVELSIGEAEGHPDVIVMLERSRRLIERVRRQIRT